MNKIKQDFEWLEFCGCGCGDGVLVPTLLLNGTTIAWNRKDEPFTKLEVVNIVRRFNHKNRK